MHWRWCGQRKNERCTRNAEVNGEERNRMTSLFPTRNQPLILLDFPANCVSAGLTVCSPDCAFMHIATSRVHPLTHHRRYYSWVLPTTVSTLWRSPLLPCHKWLLQYITIPFRQLGYVTTNFPYMIQVLLHVNFLTRTLSIIYLLEIIIYLCFIYVGSI